MTLSFNQTLDLYLAGTVAIPSVVPPLGTVMVEDDAVGNTVLIIVEQHPNCTIQRIVRLSQVVALFIPCDAAAVETEGLDLTAGKWLLGPGIEPEQIADACQDNRPPGGTGAVAHVPEDAGVLEIVGSGTTAGESAQMVPCKRNGCGPQCCCCG